MNQEDKLRHIESVQKSMTNYCFTHCFNQKKYLMDFECVSTCYHKYLFAIKTVYETIEEEGRKYQSDYVVNAVGAEPRDRFKDEVFPIGGHPNITLPDNRYRLKFFESYHFSDPLKTGR